MVWPFPFESVEKNLTKMKGSGLFNTEKFKKAEGPEFPRP